MISRISKGRAKFSEKVKTGIVKEFSSSSTVSTEVDTKIGFALDAISGSLAAKFSQNTAQSLKQAFARNTETHVTMEADPNESWFLYQIQTTVTMSDGNKFVAAGALESYNAEITGLQMQF